MDSGTTVERRYRFKISQTAENVVRCDVPGDDDPRMVGLGPEERAALRLAVARATFEQHLHYLFGGARGRDGVLSLVLVEEVP